MLKGIIMAGGEGKRFRPLTYYFQKCMIPVGEEQKPILEYIIRLLRHHKIVDLVVLTGYRHQQIVNFFNKGERFGVKIEYVLDDPDLKGSANALLNAYRKGAISKEDTLVIYYGDILSNINLEGLLKQHNETGYSSTIALARKFNISVGTADIDKKRITQFVEKPDLEKPVSIGILVINGSLLDFMDKLQKEGQLTSFDLMGDVVSLLVKQGEPVGAYLTDAFWYDVGSLEKYERLDNQRLDVEMGYLLK
ncbi:nucleotidyltransferase family protein [Candidatus Bathyarchaeota archaeon]|nr:nucleotidyltransferase family protein [Candidatus Bathyarchaeota archaeon]